MHCETHSIHITVRSVYELDLQELNHRLNRTVRRIVLIVILCLVRPYHSSDLIVRSRSLTTCVQEFLALEERAFR